MNKRGAFALAFVMLFAFSAAALARHGGEGKGGSHGGRPASFLVKAGSAEQGGTLKLRARAKHGERGQAFGATAVVHFASGDVSATLTRKGKNLDARVRVPVAQDEAVGDVPVDFTVSYGETVQSLAATGKVKAGDDDDPDDNRGGDASEPSPSPDDSPEN